MSASSTLVYYLNAKTQPIREGPLKGWLLALLANTRQGWKGHNNYKHSSLLRYCNN
jgi:hypothetical protein